MEKGAEKRKYRRFKLPDNVKIKGLTDAAGIDVSVKGACVVLDHMLKTGEIVEMEFKFPDIPNKCICQAKVMWQKKTDKGYNTGFEFKKFHLTIKA